MQIPMQPCAPPMQQPYPPPMQQYGAPYGARTYAAPGVRPGSVALGTIAMIMGAVVVASTFLDWISVTGFGATGWTMMRNGGSMSMASSDGFYIALTGDGLIFFTGFLTMLLGTLIVVGGLVLLFRSRAGGILTLLFSMAATGIAAVNIAMIYSKMQPVTPGVGLWVFAGASVTALVLGIIGMASPG